jgi:hypothetical protein
VQAGVLPGDGQAETAPGRAAAGRLGLEEALEHVGQRLARNTRAVVADLDTQKGRPTALVDRERDHDGRSSVAEGVTDQIGDDDVEAPRIQGAALVVGNVDGHGLGPAPRGQTPLEGDAEVDVIHHQVGRAGVEAGDLDQCFHEAVEVTDLLAHEPGGVAAVVHHGQGMLVEDIGDRGHRRQWGAQLVRHVPGKLPGPGAHPAEVGDAVLQRVGHVVETLDEISQLVVADGRQPDREIAIGDLLCGFGELTHRREHPSRRRIGHPGNGQDQHENGYSGVEDDIGTARIEK